MRALFLLVVSLTAASTTSAQNPPPLSRAADSPGVVVLKHHWSKERIGWERDPFGGPIGYFEQVRIRARNEKRIEDAKRGGNTAETERARRDAQTDAAIVEKTKQQAPARYRFVYKASVMNTGEKTIKEFDWDYVFFDSMTGEEVGRRQFTGVEKIAPGKTKEFVFLISTPPAQTISVQALDKKEREVLTEQVVIVRVLYNDGSVWQHP